jgi:hypothetical protein
VNALRSVGQYVQRQQREQDRPENELVEKLIQHLPVHAHEPGRNPQTEVAEARELAAERACQP